MGCCFCCLSEGDKVGRVLTKFPPTPVSGAQDGTLQKLIGRCVLAGTTPFYAPGSGRPCVYYSVSVHEERRRVNRRQDADGNWHEDVSHYWHQIAQDTQFVDFYLQDGSSKVFIPATSGCCRIQGQQSGGQSSFFNFPPPGIAKMIAERCMMEMFSWHHRNEGRTGRFRYTERSFDVNELVAALGVCSPAQDPYTGQPVKILNRFTKETLTEQYMDDNGWDSWDKDSWRDLLKYPSVLLSDHVEFTGGVVVQPLTTLPGYMCQGIASGAGLQYPQQPPAPQRQPYSQQGQPYPQQGQPYPQQGQPYPQQGQPYPQQGQPYPQQGQPYPPQNQQPMPVARAEPMANQGYGNDAQQSLLANQYGQPK